MTVTDLTRSRPAPAPATLLRPTWRAQAACLAVDLTPIRGRGYRADGDDVFYDPTTVDVAKKFCRTSCAVITECLDDALIAPPSQQWGVRGGLDAEERIALRKRRRK